ncbi:hypothetical protein BC830DRAFT_1140460 [Chytriomyces sp. MP71]|nr:hypothetical protein BC830DRAFT_1140460 [Chytriomyces sp. MP71]
MQAQPAVDGGGSSSVPRMAALVRGRSASPNPPSSAARIHPTGSASTPLSRATSPPQKPPQLSPKTTGIRNLIRAFDSKNTAPTAPPIELKQRDATDQLSSSAVGDHPVPNAALDSASVPTLQPVSQEATPTPIPPTLATSNPFASIKLPPVVHTFLRRRVLPTIVCIIALHVISPRLSASIWGLIFRILMHTWNSAKQQQPREQPKQPYTLSFISVLVNPALIVILAGFLFSQAPPPLQDRRVRRLRSRESVVQVAQTEVAVKVESSNLEPGAKQSPSVEAESVVTRMLSNANMFLSASAASALASVSPKSPKAKNTELALLAESAAPPSIAGSVKSRMVHSPALTPSVTSPMRKNQELAVEKLVSTTVAAAETPEEQTTPMPSSPKSGKNSSPVISKSWWFAKENSREGSATPSVGTSATKDAETKGNDSILSDRTTLRNSYSSEESPVIRDIAGEPTTAKIHQLAPNKRSSYARPDSPPLYIPSRLDSKDDSKPLSRLAESISPLQSDSSPETTPKAQFFQELDDSRSAIDVKFVANLDVNNLNLHSPKPTSANATTRGESLLSDEDLMKLFPLPSRGAATAPLSPTRVKSPKLPDESEEPFTRPLSTNLNYNARGLTILPTSFPVHTHLTRLHLAGNRLTGLPEEAMALLPALNFLDLSDNPIQRITRGLGACRGLKEVFARNCGLINVEEGALESLDGLEVLDLSGNHLSQFSPFAFAHCTYHLHTLILSNNRLRSLPPSLGLHRGRELMYLIISGNNFENSIKALTDPIIAASQTIVPRITKEMNAKLAVIVDDGRSRASSHGFGVRSDNDSLFDRSEKGSLFDWSDDMTHDAEYEYIPYKKPGNLGDRMRRRSSMPDMNSPLDTRPRNDFPTWGDPGDSGSTATSYHASTNPSYPYIQRLLSHLRDVFDLTPVFQPIKGSGPDRVSVSSESPRPSSKEGLFSGQKKGGIGDDPDAPGLSDEDRERIRKRQSPSRRAHIAAEILSTERTYVHELKTLVSLYVDPLERGTLNSQDLSAMFSNLKGILNFHWRTLLPALEKAFQNPDQPLGGVFAETAPYLKMYSMYYNNFDTANEFVMILEKLAASGNGVLPSTPFNSTILQSTSISPVTSTQATRRTLAKKFKNLVKIAKSSQSHTQISLQSYLIMPVQRLPRYKLLMDQLLESTPLRHPDRCSVEVAAALVRECVADLNDKKREQEEHEKGLKAMSRIRNIKGKSAGALVKFIHVRFGSRQFVMEASLRVTKCVEMSPQMQDPQAGGVTDTQLAVANPRMVVKHQVGTVTETRYTADGSVPLPASQAYVGILGQPQLGSGLDALTVYGLQKVGGREFRFLLFSDVLCWCKPVPSSSSTNPEMEFELIRVVDVGPFTRVEKMAVILGAQDSLSVGPRMASVPSEQFRGRMLDISTTKRTTAWSNSFSNSGTLMGPGTNANVGYTESESILRVADNGCILYLRGSTVEVEKWMEALKGCGCEGGDD